MSNPLARAYLEVLPSLKGAGKSISQQMSGIAPQVGKEMGRDMSRSMAASMNLQAVGAQIQGIGQQISSVGGTLTKSITLPIAGATVAAAGLVATLGWKRLVSIDTAQGQLRGLGYTTEDVDRITQNLVGALEGGMLTMGQATSAAASGLAAGVQEGAELTRYIQLLDAATAGSNGTFDEMNQIFSRIQGSGKLMTTELDMMEQRMPGFSAAVAESMGVSQQEMRGMVSAGQVSADDFLNVMESFGGDMATEYAKTWEGMVQNTGAYIAILGEQLLGGVFEQSKESIAEFIEFLSSDEVVAWAQEAGVTIGEFFGRAVEAIKTAITWWMNLDGETKKLILTIAGIAVAAGPVLLVIGKLITFAGSLVSGLGVLIGWVTRVAGAFGLAGGAGGAGALLSTLLRFAGPVGIAVSALMLLWRNSETFRNGIANLGKAVWAALQQIGAEFQRLWVGLQPVLSLIPPMAQAAFGFFQTWVLPVIQTVFLFILEIIKGVINNIVNIFSGLVDVITGVVALVSAVFRGDWSAAWDALKQIVSGALQVVWNTIQAILSVSILGIIRNFARVLLTRIWQPLFNGVRSVVTNVLNGVRNFIGSILGAVRSLFSNAWNGIRTNTTQVFNGIRSFITTVWNAIRATITTVVNAIRSVITAVWNAIRSVISSVVNGIRSVVTGGFNGVRNVVSSVMNGVRNITTNAWNAVRNGARNAVNGMQTSVSNGFRNVLNTVRNLPGQIRNVFSNARNLLVNSGKALIAGFTDGIRNAFSGAVDAVKNGVQRVRNFLPFSPAKEGPFSGKGYTTYSGKALIEDFGKGIMGSSDEAVRAAAGVTEQVAAEMASQVSIPDYVPASWSAPSPLAATHSVASAPAMAGVSAAERGGGDVHVAQLVVREEADIRKVAVELKKLQDRGRKAG